MEDKFSGVNDFFSETADLEKEKPDFTENAVKKENKEKKELSKKKKLSFKRKEPKKDKEKKKLIEKSKKNAWQSTEISLEFYRRLKIIGVLLIILGFGGALGYGVLQTHLGPTMADSNHQKILTLKNKYAELKKGYESFKYEAFSDFTSDVKVDDDQDWNESVKEMLCGSYADKVMQATENSQKDQAKQSESDIISKIHLSIKGMLKSGNDRILLIVQNEGKEENWQLIRSGKGWKGFNIPDPYTISSVDLKKGEIRLGHKEYPDLEFAVKTSEEIPEEKNETSTEFTDADLAGGNFIMVRNGKNRKAIIQKNANIQEQQNKETRRSSENRRQESK